MQTTKDEGVLSKKEISAPVRARKAIMTQLGGLTLKETFNEPTDESQKEKLKAKLAAIEQLIEEKKAKAEIRKKKPKRYNE